MELVVSPDRVSVYTLPLRDAISEREREKKERKNERKKGWRTRQKIRKRGTL
jgi:hypothetical protein